MSIEQMVNQPFDFHVSQWPPLPRMKGLFVTGTDTGVGKTIIAGAVARHLRRSGRYVEVFKPVATGCRRSRGRLLSEDAQFLAACADSKLSLEDITPLCFSTPAAPNVAAEREHREIDLEAIFSLYRRISHVAEAVVVEGVGGLLCPITDDFWIIHLAVMMRLPVIVVARAGLGTINHTLLTIHVGRSAGLDVAGVVINRYMVEPAKGTSSKEQDEAFFDEDVAVQANPSQIAARGGVPVLAIVPDEARNSVADGVIGPDTTFAIDQVDWAGIMGL